MAKKVWTADAVSVIILPSGQQGAEIMNLAQDWSSSWLLTPALWMMADEIPALMDASSDEPASPPRLTAYMLGRDEENKPKVQSVDLFWTLGSQQFKRLRLVAVRTEQDDESMRRTSAGARAAAKYLAAAIPRPVDPSQTNPTGTQFIRINLVVAPTEENRLLKGVLEQDWDANLVAAAEDRATPETTDSFVRADDERYVGFVLAHIATTAGLWAGLPVSSAEIEGDRTALNLARLQRVFVRAVTSDTLSADVALWALDRSNDPDQAHTVGRVSDGEVRVISSDFEKMHMQRLLRHIMIGPKEEQGQERVNFAYVDVPPAKPDELRKSIGQQFMSRLRDVAEGLTHIVKWYRARTEHRMQRALGEDASDRVLYDSLPTRLAPRVVPRMPDIAAATAVTTTAKPNPALWRHLRESLAAAIDAPEGIKHPETLIDENGNRLVFGDMTRVLPDPLNEWDPSEYANDLAVDLVPTGWLGLENAEANLEKLAKRLEELKPGIEDARAQLHDAQENVAHLRASLAKADVEVQRVRIELEQDRALAAEMREDHSHSVPAEYVGPARTDFVASEESVERVTETEGEVKDGAEATV